MKSIENSFSTLLLRIFVKLFTSRPKFLVGDSHEESNSVGLMQHILLPDSIPSGLSYCIQLIRREDVVPGLSDIFSIRRCPSESRKEIWKEAIVHIREKYEGTNLREYSLERSLSISRDVLLGITKPPSEVLELIKVDAKRSRFRDFVKPEFLVAVLSNWSVRNPKLRYIQALSVVASIVIYGIVGPSVELSPENVYNSVLALECIIDVYLYPYLLPLHSSTSHAFEIYRMGCISETMIFFDPYLMVTLIKHGLEPELLVGLLSTLCLDFCSVETGMLVLDALFQAQDPRLPYYIIASELICNRSAFLNCTDTIEVLSLFQRMKDGNGDIQSSLMNALRMAAIVPLSVGNIVDSRFLRLSSNNGNTFLINRFSSRSRSSRSNSGVSILPPPSVSNKSLKLSKTELVREISSAFEDVNRFDLLVSFINNMNEESFGELAESSSSPRIDNKRKSIQIPPNSNSTVVLRDPEIMHGLTHLIKDLCLYRGSEWSSTSKKPNNSEIAVQMSAENMKTDPLLRSDKLGQLFSGNPTLSLPIAPPCSVRDISRLLLSVSSSASDPSNSLGVSPSVVRVILIDVQDSLTKHLSWALQTRECINSSLNVASSLRLSEQLLRSSNSEESLTLPYSYGDLSQSLSNDEPMEPIRVSADSLQIVHVPIRKWNTVAQDMSLNVDLEYLARPLSSPGSYTIVDHTQLYSRVPISNFSTSLRSKDDINSVFSFSVNSTYPLRDTIVVVANCEGEALIYVKDMLSSAGAHVLHMVD